MSERAEKIVERAKASVIVPTPVVDGQVASNYIFAGGALSAITAANHKPTQVVVGDIVVHLDGRVELPEGADIDAAAKQFWDAVARYAGLSEARS